VTSLQKSSSTNSKAINNCQKKCSGIAVYRPSMDQAQEQKYSERELTLGEGFVTKLNYKQE